MNLRISDQNIIEFLAVNLPRVVISKVVDLEFFSIYLKEFTKRPEFLGTDWGFSLIPPPFVKQAV